MQYIRKNLTYCGDVYKSGKIIRVKVLSFMKSKNTLFWTLIFEFQRSETVYNPKIYRILNCTEYCTANLLLKNAVPGFKETVQNIVLIYKRIFTRAFAEYGVNARYKSDVHEAERYRLYVRCPKNYTYTKSCENRPAVFKAENND